MDYHDYLTRLSCQPQVGGPPDFIHPNPFYRVGTAYSTNQNDVKLNLARTNGGGNGIQNKLPASARSGLFIGDTTAYQVGAHPLMVPM